MARFQNVCSLVKDCFGQAIPLYGRIAIGVTRVKQFPVFDKEQSVYDHGRYGFEATINPLRILDIEERPAIAGKNF